MRNRNRILVTGLFFGLMLVFLSAGFLEASSRIYVGEVVGIEFSVLQVRNDEGAVSVSGAVLKPMFSPDRRSSEIA